MPDQDPCPTCGRPARRWTFPTTRNYVSCVLGHAWGAR